MKKRGESKQNKEKPGILSRISIGRIISILFILILVFMLLSLFGLFAAIFVGPVPTGNIAVIPITGTITAEGYSYGSTVSATKTIEWIEDAEENDEIKAILLDINSPGGSAVGSDEIALAVRAAEKPVVAVIREIGTSGAYWIASAADKVYANRMSVTGSIGVLGSYLEFAKLLEDYNITYRRLVSGKYKDMGSPFKELTDEEELIFQMAIDTIHSYFIDAVAENRNIPVDRVREIATGRFVLGIEAVELGLVDELGTKQDAVAYLEKELNITADLAEYRPRMSLRDILSAVGKNPIAGLGTINLQT